MARAIEEALKGLEYKPADYGKVDEAIEKAESLKAEEYVNFDEVTKAIEKVKRDKNITEQSEVDLMARAIENAIASLEIKSAEPENPQTADCIYLYLLISMSVALTAAAVLTVSAIRRKYN